MDDFWVIMDDFWVIMDDFWVIMDDFWVIMDDFWVIMDDFLVSLGDFWLTCNGQSLRQTLSLLKPAIRRQKVWWNTLNTEVSRRKRHDQ